MIKNDEIELTMTDMGSKGEGIGKADGFPLFVKDAVIGDRILAHVTKVKKNYGFARVKEILEPSANRVEPVCPVAVQCGGCQIQALSYEKQLEWKDRKVRSHLTRIGGFDESLVDAIMEAPVGSKQPFRYRNKMQVPFGVDKDGRTVCGFYAGRTHSIIPMTDCALGDETAQGILECILSYMEQYHVSPYDEEKLNGTIRHALIRFGSGAEREIMVCLIINAKKLPHEDALVDALRQIPGMTSIMINVNTKNTNVILGDEVRTLWGKDHIVDHMEELSFRISPLSFYQVNHDQAVRLYRKALEYAGLDGTQTVWDLYCGIGTISLFLAREAKEVYGIEIVPRAIIDAKQNAIDNQIENAFFYTGKSEEVVFAWEAPHPDVIVVDPPRKGCDATLLDTMLETAPERIVYVSCDSATMARDIKILCENKYKLEKCVAVDQFSQTAHVEAVVLLSKVK